MRTEAKFPFTQNFSSDETTRFGENHLTKQEENMAFVLARSFRALTARQTFRSISHMPHLNSEAEVSPHRPPLHVLPPAYQTQVFEGAVRKSSFISHCDQVFASGDLVPKNKAYSLIRSCGENMRGETSDVRIELVNWVWAKLTTNGVPMDTALWNSLLGVYIENDYDFAPLDLLKEMWSVSKASPNKATYGLLIQAYASKGDSVGAMKIIDFMLENGGAISPEIYGWLIKAFARSGDMGGVNEILKSMSDNNMAPTLDTYHHMIVVHAERGDLESIGDSITIMVENEIYPTAQTYLLLIESLVKHGHSALADTVWDKIEDVQAIIKELMPIQQRCIARGDYLGCIGLLKKGSKRTGQPSSYYEFIARRVFTMMRFSAKDFAEYVKVCRIMDVEFNVPPRMSYHALLNWFLTNNDDVDTAIEWLQKLLAMKEELKLTDRVFIPILLHMMKKKDVEGIIEMCKLATQHGLPFDHAIVSRIIIPAVGEEGSDDYNLFFNFVKESGFQLTNEPVEFKIAEDLTMSQLKELVIRASTESVFGALGDIKFHLSEKFNDPDAIEILANLNERGMDNISKYVQHIVNNLLEVDRSTDTAELLKFFKGLVERNIPVFNSTYVSMLQLLHDKELSEELFELVGYMKESGYKPGFRVYLYSLKMAAKVGNSDVAQFCFDNLINAEENGLLDQPLDSVSRLYEYLLHAYIKGGEGSEYVEKVVSLVEEMQSKNLRFDEEFSKARAVHKYLDDVADDNMDGVKEAKEFCMLQGRRSANQEMRNSQIEKLVDAKDYAGAEAVFQEVRKNGVAKWFHYYDTMKMCTFTGNTKLVDELNAEMLEKGFYPSQRNMYYKIRTYIQAGDIEGAYRLLLESIEDGRWLIDPGTIVVMLGHNSRTADGIERAESMLSILREYHPGLVEEEKLMSLLFITHVRSGNLDTAMQIFHNTNGATLEPLKYAAYNASKDGDVEFIQKVSAFLKLADLPIDCGMWYLRALKVKGDIDGMKEYYSARMAEGKRLHQDGQRMIDVILKDELRLKAAAELQSNSVDNSQSELLVDDSQSKSVDDSQSKSVDDPQSNSVDEPGVLGSE